MITLTDVFQFLGYQSREEWLAYAHFLSSCHSLSEDKENDANVLLDLHFQTLEEGFNWLYDRADAHFLRSEFKNEGIGIDKESKGINTARWEHNTEAKSSTPLYEAAKSLHLIDEMPWPQESVQ